MVPENQRKLKAQREADSSGQRDWQTPEKAWWSEAETNWFQELHLEETELQIATRNT